MKFTTSNFYTPAWAAELLVNRYFSDLVTTDVVMEPTCGDGRFLQAVPGHIQAYGVEVDPVAAAQARENSGRTVITGDFLTVSLPKTPTKVVGNPPFEAKFIDSMLEKCWEVMDFGGKAGLLLPVYLFQTASRVGNYQEKWSIQYDLVPRDLFQGLQCPLMFARFTKDRQTISSGFFLYSEKISLNQLEIDARKLLTGNSSTAACWRDLVAWALKECGGEAPLKDIYRRVEKVKTSDTVWWKEKVRQTLQRHFVSLGDGVWRFA